MAESKKYIEYLRMSKDEKDAGRQSEKNERTALSLDSTILDAKEAINVAKSKVMDEIQNYPVNWGAVVEANRDVEIAEANLSALEILKTDLF